MLKIVVIGASQIARKHLDVLKDLNNVVVVGIASRTFEKAQAIAMEYDIPSCYKDVAQMIELEQPDGILNLISADQMYSVTKQLLPLRVPIFLEKPPGLSYAEVADLASIAEHFRTLNMVGYNRRFYSVFQKGKKIIEDHGQLLGVSIEGHERFWKIKDRLRSEIRSNWLFANSTHTLDLIDFFGGEIEKCICFSNRLEEVKGDQFSVSVKYKTGALGQYVAHWYSPGGWSVKLYGEGATVVFQPLENGKWIDKNFCEHEIKIDDVDKEYKPGFYRQMQTFIHSIEENSLKKPGISLKDCERLLRLTESMVCND
ncbi:MAG: hypothetical protein CMF42_02105 [Legionellales bacterium]|nr:hypothetical protein [Legionellales bacterium]|tara:strand:+ start:705 stop:1646 length:942 start_codon:yes stop_codon:yes gene_type:complete